MKTLYTNYINSFRGLSREVWWLTLITFINRAGTMVIPFLSIYLKEELHFSFEQIGWIMTAFGIGSLVGSWLGGYLTEKIGYYKTMYASLIFTGIMFFAVQFLTSFSGFCIGIFFVMLIADTFRPAMFVAVSAYSKPENKTRSVSLIRLAINLGFAGGPAIGGIIIATSGYASLFWIDAITCIAAGILLLKVLNPKKARIQDEITNVNPQSAYSDGMFWIFLIAMMLFGFVFLQFVSTLPLYYREVHTLTESEIGLLLGMNGLTIFLLEMPFIKWMEGLKYKATLYIVIGALLTGASFLVLNFTGWTGILIISMLLMTIGEMIAFPFSNAFAMDRAKRGAQGQYMALYSIAFSFSHIFGHKTGFVLVDNLGYDNTWYIITLLSLICMLLLFWLHKTLQKRETVLS